MPGGREITGADVLAAARREAGAREALHALVRPDDAFADYAQLVAACPPERLGISPGAHAALFTPLFGEFE